ncbi:MAG: R2-like ligand-binding oxidase [Chloroflexi bacterium]|nr:R2-like ligand-binding oxidase [Chloroflexota bacterium]
MSHTQLATVTRGLRRDTPPMRLFEKAKKLGVWNPSDLDFTRDRADWLSLTEREHDVILRLTSMFQAGEEAVTLDLLPLITVVAQEGRIEEELYLTTFLWEEAKHTDFFRRFLDEVAMVPGDLSHYATDNYRAVVYEALPSALNRLSTDASAEAQIIASVTYNMIVEGVLAETGYHAYKSMLERNGLMPATLQGITLLKQDESRHIAYGIYLISRLIAEHPDLWQVAEAHMNGLLVPAVGVVNDVFALYDPVPFGLQIDEFTAYAVMQFQKRFARLSAARGAGGDQRADSERHRSRRFIMILTVGRIAR